MGFKISGAIRRNKKYFLVFTIIWIILAIVFCAPLSYRNRKSK